MEPTGEGLATVACSECAIRDVVLFADLKAEDISAAGAPVADIRLAPGEALYQAGDPGVALYTVRDGLLKLQQSLSDGSQRIVNLLGQGQVAGLEVTVAGSYEHTAIALQPTKLCRIPREVVDHLAPKLHRQLMKKWHESLSRAHECTRELATGHARQRVARLFLLIAPAEEKRVRLFGREDVGSLLGITTETASRMIADIKRCGVVREVALNLFERDIAQLTAIANGS
ncbi:MAG: Crp/Fnr family transcriptional regulator [Rhodospirillaceae bacterium]